MSDQESLKAAALPSSEALAYLGDAVYSLYVREALVRAGISHAGDLNRLSLSFVTAPKQAEFLYAIKDSFTEWEADVYHRAYNHKGLKPPKRASYAEYRAATGLEAVIGALHYTKQTDRINELLQKAEAFIEQERKDTL